MRSGRSYPADIRHAAYNIRKSHEAHKILPDLPSFVRSSRLLEAKAPGLPVYPIYPEVLWKALHPHMYLHNILPDDVQGSLVQRYSPHTWTYDLHYRWPTQGPALKGHLYQPESRPPDWPYPSESVYAPLPESSHKLHHVPQDRVQYP